VITAVDTNVLVDILEPDPRHGAASGDALTRCLAEGTVIACDVVWAEVATVYGEKQAELLAALETLGIDYSEVTQEAALEAARHWHAYRSRGGTRQRIAADFIVGGHALAQCDRLLTRDRGFYRSSFTALAILDPSRESEDESAG
jgi:predicted nucleic acid-binding protein